MDPGQDGCLTSLASHHPVRQEKEACLLMMSID